MGSGIHCKGGWGEEICGGGGFDLKGAGTITITVRSCAASGGGIIAAATSMPRLTHKRRDICDAGSYHGGAPTAGSAAGSLRLTTFALPK